MYLQDLYEKLQTHESLSEEQLALLEKELTQARDILEKLGPVFRLSFNELQYRVLHVQGRRDKLKSSP